MGEVKSVVGVDFLHPVYTGFYVIPRVVSFVILTQYC